MKQAIAKIISKLTSLPKEEIEKLIEIPPSPELGDYSLPSFVYARKENINPIEASGAICQKINSKHLEDFEKVEAKGPYVNFFINRNKLAEQTIKEILKQKDKYGSFKAPKEKTMIEFSQANTHKAFHIGHIRGTSLGESIARIYEFGGNKPIRANYQGDTGMHVAKWIWCYLKYHKKEKLRKDESWIASIYVDAVKRLSKDEALQVEVNIINEKLEKRSDKKLNALWKKTRSLSLDSFETIYKDLDTKFNFYFFESQMEEQGKKISKELLDKGIAEISDKATIVKLEQYNLGVWVLLRSDGTVLYSAKDLALAQIKFNKYKIKNSIYVVGAAQNLHFQQLFKTLKLMNFKEADKCKFVPVTEVRLPSGKMSSRTGDNILYSDFKKELVNYEKAELNKRYKLSEKELNNRSLIIAISALKYSMLKQDVNKAIVFNKEEALSFEGNTGPYLLYTYARAKSILRKAKTKNKLSISQLNEKEKSLVLQLSKFPEVVQHSYEQLSPNLIANYAYQTAQQFNEFYHSEKVIGADNESFRLALVESFSQVLKNSLSLLGIKTIEKM